MDVEIKLEPGRAAPKVIILTGEMTDQVTDLARRLTAGESRFLPGRQGHARKALGAFRADGAYAP